MVYLFILCIILWCCLIGYFMNDIYLKLLGIPQWKLKNPPEQSVGLRINDRTRLIVLQTPEEPFDHIQQEWIHSACIQSQVFSHCHKPYIFLCFGQATAKQYQTNLSCQPLPIIDTDGLYPMLVLPSFGYIIRHPHVKPFLWKTIQTFSASIPL